jgi:tight adherence protein C
MLASRILSTHTESPRVGGNLSQILAIAKTRRAKSSQEFEFQATDFVRALSLLLRNGVPPAVAISWLATKMGSSIGEVLKDASSDLELGADFADLLKQWQSLPSPIMSELAQKLLVSVHRGTPLAQQLDSLVRTANGQTGALLLKKAGSNETKMLVPTIFLILPITILFTVYPSLTLLQIGI